LFNLYTKFTLKANLKNHLINNKCKNINYVILHKQIKELQTQIVQKPIIEEIQIEPIEEPVQEPIQLQFD
jgi:hypothetical protein